jgi:heme-degrading monooxygenase HmoA
MLYSKWKPGARTESEGRRLVAATRFAFRRVRDLPFVVWHGLGFRRDWAEIQGAVGVLLAVDLRRRTTYSVSVWESEEDLNRWLRSADHAEVIRKYGHRVEHSKAAIWWVDDFKVRGAWKMAHQQLAAADRGASRAGPAARLAVEVSEDGTNRNAGNARTTTSHASGSGQTGHVLRRRP